MTSSMSTTSVYLPKNEEGAQIIDDDLSTFDENMVIGVSKPPVDKGDADQVAAMMAQFVQQRLSTVNDNISEMPKAP